MTAAFAPSFELTKLYEKVSARGTKYFVGRLGGARVTLLPSDPTEDGTPVWRLLVQEAAKAQTPADSATSSSTPTSSSAPRSSARPRTAAAVKFYASPKQPRGSGPAMPDDRVDDLWPKARS
jgi:hypothetical protein